MNNYKLISLFIVLFIFFGCQNQNNYELKTHKNGLYRIDTKTGETWVKERDNWKVLNEQSDFKTTVINEFTEHKLAVSIVKDGEEYRHKDYLTENYEESFFRDNGWHCKKIEENIFIVNHK